MNLNDRPVSGLEIRGFIYYDYGWVKYDGERARPATPEEQRRMAPGIQRIHQLRLDREQARVLAEQKEKSK